MQTSNNHRNTHMQKKTNAQNWLKTYQDFLHSQSLSKNTVKNYVADVKKFLLSPFIQVKLVDSTLTPNQVFATQHFLLYRHQLYAQVKTSSLSLTVANRRLASLRNFGRFLKSWGRVSFDPTRSLHNLPKLKISGKALAYKNMLKQKKYLPRGASAHTPLGLGIGHIQNLFKQDLINQKSSKATIKNYIADSRQFLRWLQTYN